MPTIGEEIAEIKRREQEKRDASKRVFMMQHQEDLLDQGYTLIVSRRDGVTYVRCIHRGACVTLADLEGV